MATSSDASSSLGSTLASIGNSLSGALGGPSLGLSSLFGNFGGSVGPTFSSGFGGAAFANPVAGFGALPGFAATPALFALQGLFGPGGPFGADKPFSSLAFNVDPDTGFVSLGQNFQRAGGNNLAGFGQALADIINLQGLLPDGVTKIPSLLAGHKGLGPSFVTPVLAARGRGGEGRGLQRRNTHIRFFPGQTDLGQFASALTGHRPDLLALASGTGQLGIQRALGGQDNSLTASQFAPNFSKFVPRGRESRGAPATFIKKSQAANFNRSFGRR